MRRRLSRPWWRRCPRAPDSLGAALGRACACVAALGLLCARAVRTCTTPRATSRSRASTFFTDGHASRPLVANTVARGQLREDEHLYTGIVGGQPAESSRCR